MMQFWVAIATAYLMVDVVKCVVWLYEDRWPRVVYRTPKDIKWQLLKLLLITVPGLLVLWSIPT